MSNLKIEPGGRCGPQFKGKCGEGRCCSVFGWCSRSDEHCCKYRRRDNTYHGVNAGSCADFRESQKPTKQNTAPNITSHTVSPYTYNSYASATCPCNAWFRVLFKYEDGVISNPSKSINAINCPTYCNPNVILNLDLNNLKALKLNKYPQLILQFSPNNSTWKNSDVNPINVDQNKKTYHFGTNENGLYTTQESICDTSICKSCCAQSRCNTITDQKNRFTKIINELKETESKLKLEIDRLTKEYNDKKKIIDNRIIELTKQKNDKNKIYENLVLQKQLEKNKLITEIANDINNLGNQHKLNVSKMNGDLELLKTKLIDELGKKFDEQEKMYQQKINQVIKLTGELSSNEIKRNKELYDEYNKQKDEATKKLKESREKREKELNDLIQKLNGEHEKKLADLIKTHTTSIEKIKKDNDKKLEEINQKFLKEEKDFEDFKNQIDKNIKELKDFNLKSEVLYEKEIVRLNELIKETETKNQQFLKELQTNLNNEMQNIRSAGNETKKEILNKTKISIEKKLDHLNNKKESINKSFVDQKNALEADFDKALETQKEEYIKKINDMKASNKGTLDELESTNKEYKKIFDETKSKLNSLNVGYQASIAKFDIEFENVRKRLATEFANTLKDLETKRLSLIKNAEEKTIQEIKKLEESTSKVRQEAEEESKVFNEKLKKLIEDLENEKMEVVKKQNKELEDQLLSLKEKYVNKSVELEKELSEINRKLLESETNLKNKKQWLEELKQKKKTYSLVSENVTLTFWILVILVLLNVGSFAYFYTKK